MAIASIPSSHRSASGLPVATVAVVALTGCGDGRASRPMVLDNPTRLVDLYLDCEPTGSEGCRWDVAAAPVSLD